MKRTPAQQVALAVRILDERFFDDVYERAKAELGDRGLQLGPLDLSQNTLRNYVDRKNKATTSPPLVSGLSEELAALVGDYSASTLVERYAQANGRPLPTELQEAATEVAVYWHGAGFGGLLLDWSERSQRFALQVIRPTEMDLTYAGDDPTEPTVITHYGQRPVGPGGAMADVEEIYDLTDLDAPSYRVMRGDDDVTALVHGQTFDGEDYFWRDSTGRPFHRIVVLGDPRYPYRTNGLIEATLKICVLWTWWGAGVRDAGHPSRHVRGMTLVGMDTNGADGSAGVESGPEVVHQWQDLDPEKPGNYWQWGPGFDPEVNGKAIRSYELTRMAALGLPVNYEQTGGEPTEQERRALEEVIEATYAQMRRFCSEALRRCAAIANRHDAVDGQDLDETPYGVLFRGEVEQALEAAKPEPEPAAPPAPEAPPDDEPDDTPEEDPDQ